jgi:hypothetical protein
MLFEAGWVDILYGCAADMGNKAAPGREVWEVEV